MPATPVLLKLGILWCWEQHVFTSALCWLTLSNFFIFFGILVAVPSPLMHALDVCKLTSEAVTESGPCSNKHQRAIGLQFVNTRLVVARAVEVPFLTFHIVRNVMDVHSWGVIC